MQGEGSNRKALVQTRYRNKLNIETEANTRKKETKLRSKQSVKRTYVGQKPTNTGRSEY